MSEVEGGGGEWAEEEEQKYFQNRLKEKMNLCDTIIQA